MLSEKKSWNSIAALLLEKDIFFWWIIPTITPFMQGQIRDQMQDDCIFIYFNTAYWYSLHLTSLKQLFKPDIRHSHDKVV